MNNQPINQQNGDDLPKAQDVKKANKMDTILFVIAIACGLIGSLAGGAIVPNLICIVLCAYLLIKKFRKPRN